MEEYYTVKEIEAILTNNIYDKIEKDEAPIPTVITCPRLSKDMTASLKILSTYLYKYDQSGMSSAKPPILIISNVGLVSFSFNSIVNAGFLRLLKYFFIVLPLNSLPT